MRPMLRTPDIIDVSSDDDNSDDVEIIEFRRESERLLNNPEQPPHVNTTVCLSDVQCPICFDEVTEATITSCGHIFCLECIQQSIASSTARGQTRGRRGVGLCPLCRKSVVFKDTVLLRMRKATISEPPLLDEKEESKG